MNRPEFEKLIAEEFPKAVPEKFRAMVKNVAFLVEETPSRECLREEGLGPGETLLGLYRGVPRARRGDHYGIGPTVPDVIVLYRLPIHDEAEMRVKEEGKGSYDEALRRVVHETIWHEIAHYLGLGEAEVRARESERRAESAAAAALPPKEPEENDKHTTPSVPHMSGKGAFGTLQDNFVRHSGGEEPTPIQSDMEPIERDKESPSMQRFFRKSMIPEWKSFASIDPEGGNGGGGYWWQIWKRKKWNGANSTGSEEPDRGKPPENLPI
jgi:predicted Zn-dependent protease with MMP-like domain